MSDIMFGIYFNTIRSTGETKQSVRIPVNPTDLSVKYDGENSTYNLIGSGEVIIPRNQKLATVEINSFFPRNSYMAGTVSNSWYQPEFYVNFFTRLMRNKTVFNFIINRFDGDMHMFDTSFKAIITSFETTDKGGESGDIYYQIGVSEYRDTSPSYVGIIGENLESDTTIITEIKEREEDTDDIVAGDMVTVTGPVYGFDDEQAKQYALTRKYVSNFRAVVQRVLPPDLRAGFDRCYIAELGWVSKMDCIKGNVNNSIQRYNIRTDQ